MSDAAAKLADAVTKALAPKFDTLDAASMQRHNELVLQITELKVLLGALQGVLDGKKKPVKTTQSESATPTAVKKAFPTMQVWWSGEYKKNPEQYKNLITPAVQAEIDAINKAVAENKRKAKTDVQGKIANAIRNWHKDQKPLLPEWVEVAKKYEAESTAAKTVQTPVAQPDPITP